MPRTAILVLIVLCAARAARADCTNPEPGLYACAVEFGVPQGCPIHYTAPAGEMWPPDELTLEPADGTASRTVPATTALLAPGTIAVDMVDLDSCDCARSSADEPFDRFAITVRDAMPGDYVVVPSGDVVGVGAPGPCADPSWPTEFEARTPCDRCPESPPGGCTVAPPATGGSPALGLVAIGLAVAGRLARRRCA